MTFAPMVRWRQVLLAGIGIGLVASLRTTSSFEAHRFKVDTLPATATEGVVSLRLDGNAASATRGARALVVHVSSQEESPVSLDVALDGQQICRVTAPAGRSARSDCAIADIDPAVGHAIELRSAGARRWSLDYLELATHFGHGAAPNELYIVPAGTTFSPLSFPAVLSFAALAALAASFSYVPRQRWLAKTATTIAAVVSALLLATLAVPAATPYSVIVTGGTLRRWLVLLFLPQLLGLCVWLSATTSFRWRTATAKAFIVSLVVAACFWSVPRWQLRHVYDGNYSGFLKIGRDFFELNPVFRGVPGLEQTLRLGDAAYDGEFMYGLAFDPFGLSFRNKPPEYAHRVGFEPGYRMGRIGFSLATWILSAGRWQRFPVTMMALILAGLCLCATTLSLLAQRHGKSAMYGLLPLLVPGFWVSIQNGLPEPIVAACLCGAILAFHCQRFALGALCLAFALLVRETALIAAAVIVLYMWRAHGTRTAALVAVLSLAPVVLWRLYVANLLWPAYGIQGLFFRTPMTLPFLGIIDMWREAAAGRYWPDVWQVGLGARSFSLVLIAASVLAWSWIRYGPFGAGVIAALYSVNALLLDYSAVWSHVWNAERTTFELFTLLALLLATSKLSIRERRATLALGVGITAYLLLLSLDAELLRTALYDFFLMT